MSLSISVLMTWVVMPFRSRAKLLFLWLFLAGSAQSQEKGWSFEGELRQQAVYQNVLDFGIESQESLEQLLNRLRLKVGYVPAPGWEVQVGLSSSLALSSLPPGPNDQDPLYLEQGWVSIPVGQDVDSSKLKLGRQLVSLGSGRLVSARLGPNVPLSFDGLRLQVREPEFHLDLLALSQVIPDNKVFGEISGGNVLWGAYATKFWSETQAADFYLLVANRTSLPLDGLRGHEDRYSLGPNLALLPK
jgi:alginate export protein